MKNGNPQVLLLYTNREESKSIPFKGLVMRLALYGIVSKTMDVSVLEDVEEKVVLEIKSGKYDAVLYLDADLSILERMINGGVLACAGHLYVRGCPCCILPISQIYRSISYIPESTSYDNMTKTILAQLETTP